MDELSKARQQNSISKAEKDRDTPTEGALAQRERLAGLTAEVSAALAGRGSLQKVLKCCAEALVHHLNAAFARIWTLNVEKNILELRASAGIYTNLHGSHSRMQVGEFKIGRIAQERQPVLTNTLIGDPLIQDQDWARREGMVAFAGYPLIVEDRLVGVMAMFSRQPLSAITLEGMASVANAIALGIEHRRVEDLLRRSMEKYKDLVELTTDVIYTSDKEGNKTYLNDAGYRILEAKPDQVIGQPWLKWIHPDDRERTAARFREMIERGVDVFDFESRYMSTTGRVTEVLHNVRILRDETGQVAGTQGIARIITERKRAQAENDRLLGQLHQVNQQLVLASLQGREMAAVAGRHASELRAILDSMIDAVVVCDKEGRVIDANKAGLRIIDRLTGREAPGHLVDYVQRLNLRHPDGRPIGEEELALTRALRGETVAEFEQIGREFRSGRDVYLLTSAAPICDDEGRIAGAVAVISDITRIREADKFKDEFIGVAAHELKTPIAIMKGYAQAILRTADQITPPHRKMLEAINRGADRIDGIVKDLLDISGLRVGHLELTPERIELPEFVEQAIDRKALTTPGHQIHLLKAEPVVVRGDRDRLEQVLNNLLDNAIRYSPKGGEIDVAVTAQGREAVISVKDFGIGIPKDKQQRVFERFYRAHTGTPFDYGGMGVGLYISKEIINRHGGRMWFESEEGKGSTFYFSIPLPEVAAPEPTGNQ